jgi:hypothetical protein
MALPSAPNTPNYMTSIAHNAHGFLPRRLPILLLKIQLFFKLSNIVVKAKKSFENNSSLLGKPDLVRLAI